MFIQIWSSGANQTHSPPSNLVMKDQSWYSGDEMKTVLLDTKGEVTHLFIHFFSFIIICHRKFAPALCQQQAD